VKEKEMAKVEKNEARKSLITGVLFTAIGLTISMLPPFGTLDRAAMIYLGAFSWMILMMTFQVVPYFIVPVMTLLILIITGVTDFQSAFSPFSSATIWLVIGVLGLSIAIAKSGVLNRLVLYFFRPFPETFNGQILAMYVTNLILAPLIPSGIGKLAILSPLAVNMSERYGYQKSSKGAIGIFGGLYISAGIFGHAFLTGAAAVAVMIGFMKHGITTFNFFSWLSGTWVWLAVMFIGSYFFIITYYHPEAHQKIKKGIIQAEINKLKPMSRDELITLVIIGSAVLFWITESFHGVNAALVVLCALSLFIVTGILTPTEFNQKIDWKTIVFIGAIVGVANYMTPLGVTDWLASWFVGFAHPFVPNAYMLVLVLCVLTFLARFFSISSIVLLAIFTAVFSALAENIGVSSFVIVYVVYLVAQDWNTPFNNFTMITTLAITDHKLVDYNDTYVLNLLYFSLNVIGFLLSIPFWYIAGFIR